MQIDLNGRIEQLLVRHNLPYAYYSGEPHGYKKFARDLSKWVSVPFYSPRRYKRIESTDDGVVRGLACREVYVNVADINIVVHKVAKEYLKQQHGVEDFAKSIADILSKQKRATKEQVKAIDRWAFLEQRKEHLLERVGRQQSSWYGYHSIEPSDDTQKLLMSVQEYNEQLKAIEKEMRRLAKKHDFLNIDRVSFHYFEEDEEANEPPDYDEYDDEVDDDDESEDDEDDESDDDEEE